MHADVEWLQEIINLLGAHRQIVLYGPPGTGKTWLARALAHHVTDGGAPHGSGRVRPSDQGVEDVPQLAVGVQFLAN